MDLSHLSRGQITRMGSGFCVLLTVHFTLQLLAQHLFHWKNPKEQKAVVIIILMAPIYAVVSFVGLLDVRGSKEFFTLLESIKECYEALVSAPFCLIPASFSIRIKSSRIKLFLYIFFCLQDSNLYFNGCFFVKCGVRWLQSSCLWCIVTWTYQLAKMLCLMKSKEERFTIHFQWPFFRYVDF